MVLIFIVSGLFIPGRMQARDRAPDREKTSPGESVHDENLKKSGSLLLDEPDKKDPFVAGLLSWSWTGLGQFYTQDYKRGSLFLMTDIAQKGLLVYLILHYSNKYSGHSGNIVKWQDMSGSDKGLIISVIFSILLVKVVCVVDAVYSAERYNNEIYFPYWKNINRVRLSLDSDGRSINLSMTKSF
jgi:hypothetical protein